MGRGYISEKRPLNPPHRERSLDPSRSIASGRVTAHVRSRAFPAGTAPRSSFLT